MQLNRLLLVLTLFSAAVANGNPIYNKTPTWGAGLLFSNADGDGVDAERNGIGVEVRYPFSPKVWATLGFDYIYKAEADSWEGSGFWLTPGIRGLFHKTKKTNFYGHAGLGYLREKYKNETIEGLNLELKGTLLGAGVTAEYKVSRTLFPYIGINFLLMDEVDAEVELNGASSEGEVEVDSDLSVTFGAILVTGKMFFRPSITLGDGRKIWLEIGSAQ